MTKNISDKNYSKKVSQYSPPSPLFWDMAKAFVSGGIICIIGQALKDFYFSKGIDETFAFSLASATLVFLASLLTALNVFEKIAKFAGAGTLVPITGFSNAMTSPAMEYRADGFILGVGAKMFTVAGPVIVYGIFSSFVAGIIYYFFMR